MSIFFQKYIEYGDFPRDGAPASSVKKWTLWVLTVYTFACMQVVMVTFYINLLAAGVVDITNTQEVQNI